MNDPRYANDKPILVETTAYRDAKTALDWVTDILILFGLLVFAMDILAIVIWELDYFFRVKPADRQAFIDNRQAYLQAMRAKLYLNLILYTIYGIIIFLFVLTPLALIFMPCSYVPPTAP